MTLSDSSNSAHKSDPCGPGKALSPTRSIRLRTDIPGPLSRAAYRRQVAASGRAQAGLPIAVAKAHGVLIYDVDGNVFIDFATAPGSLPLGHTPDALQDAVREQAEGMLYGSAGVTIEPSIRLCERLNTLVPAGGSPNQTRLFELDVTALQAAIEVSRVMTGHKRVLSVGTAPIDGAERVRGSDAERALLAAGALSDVAALILSPAALDQGFRPVSAGAAHSIAKRCEEAGTLLIVDERLTGMGRTGTLFAVEQLGIQADLLLSGRALASGLPLAALTGSRLLMGQLSSLVAADSVQCSPLSSAAALATLDYTLDQNLPRRADQLGALIREHISDWQAQFPIVGAVQGSGALLSMEIVSAAQPRLPDPERAAGLVQAALERGLILERGGGAGSHILFLMPLIIPEEQLYEGLAALEAALAAAN